MTTPQQPAHPAVTRRGEGVTPSNPRPADAAAFTAMFARELNS
jgi:hypothetical protein